MRTLIVKRDATGDVVRTTSLLRKLDGHVVWVTAPRNVELLHNASPALTCVSWSDRESLEAENYDLVINLEDDFDSARFIRRFKARHLYGAYLNRKEELDYTESASSWFDLGLISRHGRTTADRLKLENRRSYQDHVFSGLGLVFEGDEYVLPQTVNSDLSGDVAIAPNSGPVWPMKGWAYYDELQARLEADGLRVNVLPIRPTLAEHLADVKGHRCLVSGDSLPMHFALGARVRCVTLFNCTSPWEIFDYRLQVQLISPYLAEFFYRRGMDMRAVTAIDMNTVYQAVCAQLEHATAKGPE